MTAQELSHLEVSSTAEQRIQHVDAEYLTRVIRILTGALIGTVLTVLFSIVIFAFVVKAFVTSEEMSFHLLNSAITLVGTTLGAVLGYILGRNANGKSELDAS